MGKRRIKKPSEDLYMIGTPNSHYGAEGLNILKKAAKEKACTSKDIYYTEKQASTAALMCRVNGNRGVYEYRCRYCPNWHIGHRFND